MGMIKVKDGTQIYFKDWGEGQPVVFSHGYPLNADSWDEQLILLAQRATLKVYPGAPHGFSVTHRDQFHKDLLEFIRA